MKTINRILPTILNWCFWSLLFFLFSWWHGAFQTALSPAEIKGFAEQLHIRNPERSLAEYRQLLAADKGQPVYMVNMIKYFDDPVKTGSQEKGMAAEKLVRKYNSYVGQFLIQRGSYPVFMGEATGGTAAAWGVDESDAEGWSKAVIVRYRNMRTLMELATDEQFNKKFDYKRAALEKTIVYPTARKLQPGGLGSLVFFILLSCALGAQLMINKWMK